MARSQPLLFARKRYGPRETYKHKMDALNILRGLTDCLMFPFSKIYKATFYHYSAQIQVHLKRAHQVLDNTNIPFELLSNPLHKELYDSFDCLQWPPRSSHVAGQYYTIID